VAITREQSLDLKAFVHELQPDCLVSGRVGHSVGDYGSLGDNQIPPGRSWAIGKRRDAQRHLGFQER